MNEPANKFAVPSKKAFTLIEVLVSAAILFLAAFSISYLVKADFGIINLSAKYQKALNLAQSKMEEIRSTDFPGIKNSTFADNNGTTAVKPITYDLLEIKLSYNWDNKRPPIEFYTLRSKY